MSRPLPEALKAPITNLAEGKAWIRGLIAADMLFHFEDSPSEIIEGKTSKRLFSAKDAKIVSARLAELYNLEWGPKPGMGRDYCPIGFALTCEPFNEENQAEGFEAGAVLAFENRNGKIIDRSHCASYEYGTHGMYELHPVKGQTLRFNTFEAARAALRKV